jgi:hypothetical protein
MKLSSFVLMLFLIGCAALQPGADQAVAVDEIVGEVMNAARASSGEQKAALARAQQLFMNDSTSLNRVRLAALLATLSSPLREPMVDANTPGVGRLAALLAAHLAERQRLAREVDRLGKERANLERDRQNADKERDKREEALRQQLEALRAIERGILDREERLRGKPGAKP